MRRWFQSGAPWIWMTAGTVSLSLVAVLGLLLLIGWKGLSYFWPASVYQFEVDGPTHPQVLIGEIYEVRSVPVRQLAEAGRDVSAITGDRVNRYLVKIGNRERVSLDFITLLEPDINSRTLAMDVAVIDRLKNGKFYGYPIAFVEDGKRLPLSEFPFALARADQIRAQIKMLQDTAIVQVSQQLDQLHRQERRQGTPAAFTQQRERLERQFRQLEMELIALRQQLDDRALLVREMTGETVRLPLDQVLNIWYPNNMSLMDKVAHWGYQVAQFVSEAPREANTEGGVFPAIFGTVLMVLLMSVIVTPLGVMAAIYLHEYAGKNSFTKLIRIAVINLAGVPSIVYGVFGLGFFVYMVGGSIDALLFSEKLPTPTFGTPGILWSALTLAILTLPVVIVSTEEGLARIPNSVRHGSLALGATQAETLWRIVLPMASPAIMTGLILAVARAAGEVAPLMLVGVVKMAPALPVDEHFPYLHLERKFMHLGYHIYDVGFQSPNVEAARPLVYATSFLLVTVIVGLNLTAIGIRNHLREKFRALEQ
ncbi:phosphate ABC transporter permease PstA [Photobacterium sp. TY1-4]|uniref:phosphate ABC transporter permease PstA n=1 Tax=Photobacterium sp. TY1-4 TaxID=2899122 RepID=UPI0021BEDF29|nr:phosphate ABC transporter permease PstA [Photobacterium sp. TY1-4]UXI00738.1 phosphate ABC transporter permease PstA [Photobacterium sp. TY1-4]